MSLYQVVVKSGDQVVFTCYIENADSANEAAERGRKLSQLPYDNVEVYDGHDESEAAAPLLKKIARP